MDQNQSRDEASPWCIPKISRKQTCDFYEPDNMDDKNDNTVVSEVAFAHMTATADEKQVACYFASAMCAFCATLSTVVKNALGEHEISLNVIKLPSDADSVGIDLNVVEQYDQIEIFTLMGSCLIALFKSVSPVNYESFITQRVYVLARKLGMPDERVLAFKFPFQAPHASAICNVLGSSFTLKQEVLKFLIWLGKTDGKIAIMARYVCTALAWSEMGVFVCIYQKMCVSRSPVLTDEEVVDEVPNFAEAMRSILRSEIPQFYWYLCTDSQRLLLARDRFPILAEVAQELKKEEITASSTKRFDAMPSTSSNGIVERLLKIHTDYINSST